MSKKAFDQIMDGLNEALAVARGENKKAKFHVPAEKVMKIHESLTHERIAEACERRMSSLDDPGFCIACGEEAKGVEPDARSYECEHCGQTTVYGAEELAFHLTYINEYNDENCH